LLKENSAELSGARFRHKVKKGKGFLIDFHASAVSRLKGNYRGNNLQTSMSFKLKEVQEKELIVIAFNIS
jgi:hypothetical protein